MINLRYSIFHAAQDGKNPFSDSLMALMDRDLSIPKAMNLISAKSQLDSHAERYQTLRMKLFKKHGTPVEGEEGKIQIANENLDQFLKDMEELGATGFHIDAEPVSLEGEDVKMKASDLMNIRPLISWLPEAPSPETETP